MKIAFEKMPYTASSWLEYQLSSPHFDSWALCKMDLQQKFLDSQETLFSDEENIRILFTDLQPCMPTVIAD